MQRREKVILLVRMLHVVAALYNLIFVYTVLHDWQHGLFIVQYVTMPLLLVSGIALMRIRKARELSIH